MHDIDDADKHNVYQWKMYWNIPITIHVWENLKHTMLHDVSKYIRAIHKENITQEPVINNSMTLDESYLQTNQ